MGGAGSPALWPCTAPDGPGTSGCSVAHGLRVGQEAVLREHADPARRVALDDEAFVVDARVGVRSVVAQHGVDHAQQLVGGGKDGPLVAEVIFNGPSDEQRRKLRVMGITARLHHVLISEEYGSPKPSPEIFLGACQMAGVEPRAAVHVGDHYEIDIVGARAAGLRGVWLDRQGAAPDAARPDVVSSLQELPELLDRDDPQAPTS